MQALIIPRCNIASSKLVVSRRLIKIMAANYKFLEGSFVRLGVLSDNFVEIVTKGFTNMQDSGYFTLCMHHLCF